ncbi:DivIVA domain-containing protein [Solwaraspora sp. WMMD1047]|uniref:DivIVA domain-containing protein n=1 Tax=Solwaraspora sp. WMMD1047 TaxID=3016102 RepID=UPI002415E2C5|nr:DivIVA domain-containing protein [Solwaraspora sp. WMMD1047]MDG4833581.1 DivIVA domain-containing protein [Solwaraspora sp. WMMD1047]
MSSPFMIALRGYDIKEVDGVLAQADEALASGSESLRASAREALQSAAFRTRLRGYDRREVDDAMRDRLNRLGR